MKKNGFLFITLLSLAGLLFVSGAYVRKQVARADGARGILWAGLSRPFGVGDSSAEPEEVFESVLNSLRSDYVDRITDQKRLTYGAVEGMVDALHDPYSRFLTPEGRKRVEEAQRGEFHGLGAIVLLRRAKRKALTYEHLVVINVLPGGPAEKAGVRPGDTLVRLNDRYFVQVPDDVSTDDVDPATVRELFPLLKEGDDKPLLTYKEAIALLSEDGKTLSLTVQRAGQTKTEELKVALAPTQVTPVVSRLEQPGVGYLAVRGFTMGSADLVKAALTQLKADGATSLLLDLRGNFGGSLNEAQTVAALLSDGPLGYVTRRVGAKQTLRGSAKRVFEGKIVVLVNRATLGVGELLAAALADSAKAEMVGDVTFGDGLDQSLLPLSDGSAIQLTTGKFTSPSGLDYNQKGVKPTHLITSSPEKQIETAVALAKTPGSNGT